MKFGMVSKLTIVNRSSYLHHNITHLTVITCKTNIKLDILKGRGVEMSQFLSISAF